MNEQTLQLYGDGRDLETGPGDGRDHYSFRRLRLDSTLQEKWTWERRRVLHPTAPTSLWHSRDPRTRLSGSLHISLSIDHDARSVPPRRIGTYSNSELVAPSPPTNEFVWLARNLVEHTAQSMIRGTYSSNRHMSWARDGHTPPRIRGECKKTENEKERKEKEKKCAQKNDRKRNE